MKTIARVYDTYGQARQVVADLESTGVATADINLIANRYICDETARIEEPSAAGAGAGVGAALGGTAGLLAGLGVIAIPGLGPVVAAGWLAATAAGLVAGAAAGAAASGIVGALMEHGVTEDHAQIYAEGVRHGGTLLTVRVDEDYADEVKAVLDTHGPVNAERRAEEYRAAESDTFGEAANLATPPDRDFGQPRRPLA